MELLYTTKQIKICNYASITINSNYSTKCQKLQKWFLTEN